MRDAFLDASGGRAALLPSIRALGDPDEDAAIIFGAEGNADQGFAGAGGARAIGPLERRVALMRLVLAWSKKLHESGKASGGQVVPPVATPAQASYLAADLANLMDFIESEEVGLSALQRPRAGGALGALAADSRVPEDRHRQLARTSSRQWPRLAHRATERADGLRGGAPHGQIHRRGR